MSSFTDTSVCGAEGAVVGIAAGALVGIGAVVGGAGGAIVGCAGMPVTMTNTPKITRVVTMNIPINQSELKRQGYGFAVGAGGMEAAGE
jgi:hypothetical protein